MATYKQTEDKVKQGKLTNANINKSELLKSIADKKANKTVVK